MSDQRASVRSRHTHRQGYGYRHRYRLLTGCALLSSILIVSTQASAHCWPVEQTPGAGAALDSHPKEIRIRFNQPIEPAASRIQVDRFDGQRIKTPASASPDGESDVLSVPLPVLAPGRYRVTWIAVTLDGHTSHGDYGFELH